MDSAFLQRQLHSSHLTSVTAPLSTASSQSSPPSPSTPPSLTAPSVPSSPLSLAATSTPPSSSSSLPSLQLPIPLHLPPLHQEQAATNSAAAEGSGKQWQASVDSATLRITLKSTSSHSHSSTPAKRPAPTPPRMHSSDSEPEPLMDITQPPSPTLSASSTSTSSSPPISPTARTAASSSRRLPWTAIELSALIQGVGKYGKDWAAIMRDDKLGRLLRRRTVVACRKQFMFGRAMGQWRKGTRELPELHVERDTDSKEGKDVGEAEANGEEEEAEGKGRQDDESQQASRDEVAETEPVLYATRARTRSARRRSLTEEKETVVSETSDESEEDVDMSDDTEPASQTRRHEPWSNVRADELPPGKQRSEYRRCRHTCGCKGRTSGDKRAVVNKHGRRNHEKSESQHPYCSRRYTCHRLFGNLKVNGEDEQQEDDEEDEQVSESEQSEEDEEEEEKNESEQPQRALSVVQGVAMDEDGVRPVFGPPFPLPAAPPLYRPSSVLAHSGVTSTSLHATTLPVHVHHCTNRHSHGRRAVATRPGPVRHTAATGECCSCHRVDEVEGGQ